MLLAIVWTAEKPVGLHLWFFLWLIKKIILLKAENPVQFNMKMDSRFEHFVKTVAHQSATREKIDPIKYILEQCFWKTRLT